MTSKVILLPYRSNSSLSVTLVAGTRRCRQRARCLTCSCRCQTWPPCRAPSPIPDRVEWAKRQAAIEAANGGSLPVVA